MASWIETVLDNAKQQMKEMAAEISGVPYVPENENNDENNDKGPLGKKQNIPIYEPFRLPITYLPEDQVHPLSPVVVQDLELSPVQSPNSTILDASATNVCPNASSSIQPSTTSLSMYEHLFQPTHPFAKDMIQEWSKQFTSNTQYLKDTQQVIQETPNDTVLHAKHERLMEIWKDTKEDDFFLEKYCYVEWDVIKVCNQSPTFLQVLSIGNIMSPVISLLLPVLFLVFPFIILKIRGIPITFSVYLDVLKEIAKGHFIGKTLLNLSSITLDKALYLLVGLLFYLYQIYQNVLQCLRFYRNIHKINDQLYDMRSYLGQVIQNMDNFAKHHCRKPTYTLFCHDVQSHSLVLKEFYAELEPIQPVRNFVGKLGSIGYLLKCYYELHSNKRYETSMRYSFGFEGFLDNLRGVKTHLWNQSIGLAVYDGSTSCIFDAQYYPPHHASENNVKNRCDLSKSMVITGPNASGKTTYLKTTTINIIFSQQVGYGFYAACTLNPYTHIHSYLNIPDTSERDSLFQAESRRCKEIITLIRDHPANAGYRHYCIFDELYSGTNPLEATKSAHAFLAYLAKHDHVNFILTTHYVSLCTKLKKSKALCKRIENYKMLIETDATNTGKIVYTYKIKEGISKIQGALHILEEMDYPEEILDNIRKDRSNKRKRPNKKVK